MHLCLSCRRELTSPVSIKWQRGPVCLRKAVAMGPLPIEAALELSSEQRETKRRPRIKPAPVADIRTPDLFDQLRDAALDDLRLAVAACALVGVTVSYQISD